MNNKGKFFMFGLIFLIVLSISAVSASENITSLNQTSDVDDVQLDDSDALSDGDDEWQEDNPVECKIIAKDYTANYGSGKQLCVKVEDLDGNVVEDVKVKIKYYRKNTDYEYTDCDGKAYFSVGENVGKHTAYLSIDDNHYTAKRVKITINILKTPVKVSVKRMTVPSNTYFKLKATIRDKYGYLVDKGNVKFTINGKTYNSKVKKGVATVKVKLPKIAIFTYKAAFSSKNYKSKSAYSKVVSKDIYKWHTYTFGNYKFIVNKYQYDRIQYVLKHKHDGTLKYYADFNIKTGKYHTYKIPIYKKVKVAKTKWVYKNVLVGEDFYYDGGYDSYSYSDSYYYNNGWTYIGNYYTSNSDYSHTKYYNKYKKKVAYYDTEEVLSHYKTVTAPIVARVTTYEGINSGNYLNYPQVQFIAMYGKNSWDWKYLTGHMMIK